MPWYKVTKTVNGHRYDYWQRTWREGKSVKTENRYIGPAQSFEPRPRDTIARDLEQATTHRDLLADLIADHPAKFFLKYRGRTDRQNVAGTSFAELNAKAMITGAKGKRMDTYLSEHGFADFDELDAAAQKYFQLKQDHAAAKARVARLKKERAEARRDDAAMPSPPIRTSKNIHDFAAPPRTTTLYAGEFVIILGKKPTRRKPKPDKLKKILERRQDILAKLAAGKISLSQFNRRMTANNKQYERATEEDE